MDAQRRKAIGLGVAGLILIVLGLKYLPGFVALATHQAAPKEQAALNEQAVVLFFNVDEPCECMLELAANAEKQIANWPGERRGDISVMHLWMDERKDLEARYQVFRAPCLVLVDTQGQIAWRQDYPLIAGEPFKLDELERAIAALHSQ